MAAAVNFCQKRALSRAHIDAKICLTSLNPQTFHKMSLADLVADWDADEEDASQESVKTSQVPTLTLDDICTLRNSPRIERTLESIEKWMQENAEEDDLKNLDDDSLEFQLFLEANGLVVDINNDIDAIYNYVKDLYSKYFPELGSMVWNPIDYLLAAKILGDDVTEVRSSPALRQRLEPETIMALSVTASISRGMPLSKAEQHRITEACDTAMELENVKERLTEFIECKVKQLVLAITP